MLNKFIHNKQLNKEFYNKKLNSGKRIMKQFDAFSFKQQSQSLRSISSSRKTLVQQVQEKQQNQNKYKYIHKQSNAYRYLQNQQPKQKFSFSENEQFFSKYSINSNDFYPINQKVKNLDKEIQQNLKKRLELQNKLQQIKKFKMQQQSEESIKKYSKNFSKKQEEIQKQFIQRNIKKQIVNQQIRKIQKYQSLPLSLEKSLDILKGDQNNQIVKNAQMNFKKSKNRGRILELNQFMREEQEYEEQLKLNKNFKNTKKAKIASQLAVQPSALQITKLINRCTFPQTPKQNIQKLYNQCQKLEALYSSHSDIIYLMMICNFHLKKYHDVRKYFKQILMFKKFQQKAYWVAAQAEYEIGGYQPCLKLTELCMNNLSDKFLPRFIYLKAKCYNSLGNFTNSIICYNELIKIRPKIGQYYLQRSILFSQLGYKRQSEQDLTKYGLLKPEGKQYLKEQILLQQNQSRRKQMLKIYSRFIN